MPNLPDSQKKENKFFSVPTFDRQSMFGCGLVILFIILAVVILWTRPWVSLGIVAQTPTSNGPVVYAPTGTATDNIVYVVVTATPVFTEEATKPPRIPWTPVSPTAIVVTATPQVAPTRTPAPRPTNTPVPRPSSGILFVREPGVRGVTDSNEAGGSAVDMSLADNQFPLENSTGSILLNQDGYVMVTTNGACLTIGRRELVDGDYIIANPMASVNLPAETDREWIFIVKGLPGEPKSDNNLFIEVSCHNAGATLASRFPVLAQDGMNFSIDYTVAQAQHSVAPVGGNCGSGCDAVSLYVLDMGTGEYAIAQFDIDTGRFVVSESGHYPALVPNS